MNRKGLVLVAALGFAGAANAGLIDRGNGLIYDDVLNITWLWDANYAQTSGYDSDGFMTWDAAVAWADGLVYGGYNDWRLPTTLQPDSSCAGQSLFGTSYGYGCTGSEMGHMFYNNMGATAGNSILNGTNSANLGLFDNIQSYLYWSGTEYMPSSNIVWGFYANDGYQSAQNKGSETYAWAVRPGDVAASSSVPEPATFALLGLGLAGLSVMRRLKVERSLSATV